MKLSKSGIPIISLNMKYPLNKSKSTLVNCYSNTPKIYNSSIKLKHEHNYTPKHTTMVAKFARRALESWDSKEFVNSECDVNKEINRLYNEFRKDRELIEMYHTKKIVKREMSEGSILSKNSKNTVNPKTENEIIFPLFYKIVDSKKDQTNFINLRGDDTSKSNVNKKSFYLNLPKSNETPMNDCKSHRLLKNEFHEITSFTKYKAVGFKTSRQRLNENSQQDILLQNFTKRPTTKQEAKLHMFLDKCDIETDLNKKDLIKISKAKKKLKLTFSKLNNKLTSHKIEDITKKDVKTYIKNKHLFIYGRNGLGRFLTSDGMDVLKIRDHFIRSGYKYSFINKKFKKMIEKKY